MAKELIINASLPEVRIALMEEGRIQELLIERQSDKGIVGNIYKGRVTRVLPGMQAAFVDVGLDKAAFLYVDDIYVHPKVMGEETEVSGEEFEEMSPDEEGQIFETVLEAGSSEEGMDTATLEAQASEHLEQAQEEVSGEFQNVNHEPRFAEATSESYSETEAAVVSEEMEEDEDLEGSEESEESEGSDEMDEDSSEESSREGSEGIEGVEAVEGAASEGVAPAGGLEGLADQQQRRGRRGRNRNRSRRGGKGADGKPRAQFAAGESHEDPTHIPDSVNESLNEVGNVESDRAAMAGEAQGPQGQAKGRKARPEFREQRGRDRRIKSKNIRPRAQANISDLLKEGQEVIVQIAKDPIATKGARLTCHVSLPGRHLVCMPSIDHVGVSRRIERDDERRRLRDFVEKNRPRKMGFIVRTASGGKDPESWIKQDIDYLSKLWGEIRTRADDVSAPSLVYEDLNSTLRAIRDWVNEDIDRIIVDTRYHYNELIAFAERFMPALIEKIELYQGDIPVFDAYGLSSELTRSLERRVWLKSGGYIVIDQAEALVAIDVNTGRFVGKKNLEDTILKTNLEAAEEIAYQLRLRNCGGIIIVDFIDMEREDNKMRVYRALDEALKKDRARPTIQKISELGLVEMTRKRTRDTLVRSLCEPCSHCEGRGYTKTNQTVAYEILREIERLSVDREAKKILVSAHEAVINILAIELREALDQLERRYNKSVYLQTILEFHSEQFEVVSDRMQGKKQSQDIARQLRMERERSERKEKGKQRRNEQSSPKMIERDRSDSEDESSAPPAPRNNAPQPPAVKPSGAFITARAATITPVVRSEEKGNQATEGEVQTSDVQVLDEDRQPNFDAPKPKAPVATQNFSDMDDEDQLAYLRAQAAQDAAIASLGSNNAAQGQGGNNRNPRGQNFRNQGQNQNQNNNRNRNQNNNRNRNQNNRGGNQGGAQGNRFRPQGNMMAQGNNRNPDAIGNVQAPEFEAPVRQGDGSES
jgi:ribonuclease G